VPSCQLQLLMFLGKKKFDNNLNYSE